MLCACLLLEDWKTKNVEVSIVDARIILSPLLWFSSHSICDLSMARSFCWIDFLLVSSPSFTNRLLTLLPTLLQAHNKPSMSTNPIFLKLFNVCTLFLQVWFDEQGRAYVTLGNQLNTLFNSFKQRIWRKDTAMSGARSHQPSARQRWLCWEIHQRNRVLLHLEIAHR